MKLKPGATYSFDNATCGVIGADGCALTLPVFSAVYIGTTFHCGKMVEKFDILEPFPCPFCGRTSKNVYVVVKHRTKQRKMEAESVLSRV